MADPGDRQNQLPLHPDDKLTAVFVDHGGQKFVGNESAVKASFARVGSATYKPTTGGRICSCTPVLHARGRGSVEPVPHE